MIHKQRRYLDRIVKDLMNDLDLTTHSSYDKYTGGIRILSYISHHQIHSITGNLQQRREIKYSYTLDSDDSETNKLCKDLSIELLIDIAGFITTNYGVKEDEVEYVWEKYREKVNLKIASNFHRDFAEVFPSLMMVNSDVYELHKKREVFESLYGVMHRERTLNIIPSLQLLGDYKKKVTYRVGDTVGVIELGKWTEDEINNVQIQYDHFIHKRYK